MTKGIRPKVLAVDDELWNLKLLETHISSMDMDLTTTTESEDCVRLAREIHPDVVLLDIQMPSLDGVEVCRQLKRLPETRNIPVIFVTAFSDVENQAKAIEAGAQGFVTKPIQDLLLKALLKNAIQVKSLSDEVSSMISDRSALTSMLVHDINNLIAIASLSCDGALEDPTLSPQIKKRISMAFRASENIKNMTGSLLDLAKMESGSLTVALTPVDLHDLVRERVELGQTRATEMKGITFKTLFTDGKPIVLSDRGLLTRVLDNFIANAVKYSPEKATVEFQTRLSEGHCVFSVTNGGPAVPMEYHQKIFEKFGQVESRQANERKGVGLGLAFCKMALEKMNGDVTIQSPLPERDDGVRFNVHLPTELTESKKLNILVVDDDMESVTPLQMCLKKFGCTVKIVNTGHAAIHEMLSEDRNYDLVILDWSMPDLNGRQTLVYAQQIISGVSSVHHFWKGKPLPVVTFSGRARNEMDLPACKNFSFIDHWEKPAAHHQLFEKVSEMLWHFR